MKSKLSLLNLTNGGELIKFSRKPVSENHPWKKSFKTIRKSLYYTEERNLRWLNQWCEKTNKSFNILWTSDLYTIEEKQDFFPKVDKALLEDFEGYTLETKRPP